MLQNANTTVKKNVFQFQCFSCANFVLRIFQNTPPFQYFSRFVHEKWMRVLFRCDDKWQSLQNNFCFHKSWAISVDWVSTFRPPLLLSIHSNHPIITLSTVLENTSKLIFNRGQFCGRALLHWLCFAPQFSLQ